MSNSHIPDYFAEMDEPWQTKNFSAFAALKQKWQLSTPQHGQEEELEDNGQPMEQDEEIAQATEPANDTQQQVNKPVENKGCAVARNTPKYVCPGKLRAMAVEPDNALEQSQPQSTVVVPSKESVGGLARTQSYYKQQKPPTPFCRDFFGLNGRRARSCKKGNGCWFSHDQGMFDAEMLKQVKK